MKNLKTIMFLIFCYFILINQNWMDDSPPDEFVVNEHKINKKEIALQYYRSSHDKDIINLVYYYCEVYQVDLSLMVALIECESGFNIYAYNQNIVEDEIHSIDRGLCQLNNKSFPFLKKDDFYNPVINIRYGVKHLRECIDNSLNSTTGIMVYNGGLHNFKRNRLKEITYKHTERVMKRKSMHDEEIKKRIENAKLKREGHITC